MVPILHPDTPTGKKQDGSTSAYTLPSTPSASFSVRDDEPMAPPARPPTAPSQSEQVQVWVFGSKDDVEAFSKDPVVAPLSVINQQVPQSLYPLPSTHYPLPPALCPLPSALYPLPSTLCPLPSTLYPLPSTLNPKS